MAHVQVPRIVDTKPPRITRNSRVQLRGAGHAGEIGTAIEPSSHGWWVKLDSGGRRINVAVRFLRRLEDRAA